MGTPQVWTLSARLVLHGDAGADVAHVRGSDTLETDQRCAIERTAQDCFAAGEPSGWLPLRPAAYVLQVASDRVGLNP